MIIYNAIIEHSAYGETSFEHNEFGADRAVLQARMEAERQRIAPGEWKCGCQRVGEVEYTCYIEEITLVC